MLRNVVFVYPEEGTSKYSDAKYIKGSTEIPKISKMEKMRPKK